MIWGTGITGLLLAIEQEGGLFLSRVKNGSVLPPQVASRVDLQGLQVLPQCRPHDFQKPPHHSKPAARLTCRTTRLWLPFSSSAETGSLRTGGSPSLSSEPQRSRPCWPETSYAAFSNTPHRLRKPCPAKSCSLSTKSLTQTRRNIIILILLSYFNVFRCIV